MREESQQSSRRPVCTHLELVCGWTLLEIKRFLDKRQQLINNQIVQFPKLLVISEILLPSSADVFFGVFFASEFSGSGSSRRIQCHLGFFFVFYFYFFAPV